jgi:hypothetical protein
MARTPDAVDTATVSEQHQGQSSSRLRLEPQQSDVRALGGEGHDVHAPFELGRSGRLQPLQPAALGLDDALAQFGAGLPDDSAVSHALQLGDLPRAIVLLLHANHSLHQELEAAHADFDELRAVNVAIQERMDEALGVADDQRIELIEELERAHDAVLALENQLEQARLGYGSDIERCRQEREGLESELAEVNSLFSDYQSRLWVNA